MKYPYEDLMSDQTAKEPYILYRLEKRGYSTPNTCPESIRGFVVKKQHQRYYFATRIGLSSTLRNKSYFLRAVLFLPQEMYEKECGKRFKKPIPEFLLAGPSSTPHPETIEIEIKKVILPTGRSLI